MYRLYIVLFLAGFQNTLQRGEEQLPTFSKIRPYQLSSGISTRLAHAVPLIFRGRKICPEQWKIQSSQSRAAFLRVNKWMQGAKLPARELPSPGQPAGKLPRLCVSLSRAHPASRRRRCAASAPPWTPRRDARSRPSWEPLVSPSKEKEEEEAPVVPLELEWDPNSSPK